MANIYVDSAATGLADGTTWADAYTTLNAATSVATGSDTVWVKNTHAETAAADKNISFPTAAPGLKVLCTSDATEPPTSITTGATVSTTGNTNVALVSGYAYVYGITFNSGTENSGAADLLIAQGNAHTHLVFEQCELAVLSTSIAAPIIIGGSGGSSSTTNKTVDFIDCTFRVNATSITSMILAYTGFINFSGMTIVGTGSAPTNLFAGANQTYASVFVENSDLSGRAFTNLLEVSSYDAPSNRFLIRNCKLPSGVNLTAGTFGGPGALTVEMHNCDSADTHIRFARENWQGSVTQYTGAAFIVTGGATQADSTAFSWLMTGSANSVHIAHPLVSPDIAVYNTSVGSSMTATVEILCDTATALDDDEIWLEVDYPGTTGFPQSNREHDRVDTVIATPAPQDTSTAAWADTSSMTNPKKQKLVVTFTPQEAGYIIARVKLAANKIVYVDPVVTLA